MQYNQFLHINKKGSFTRFQYTIIRLFLTKSKFSKIFHIHRNPLNPAIYCHIFKDIRILISTRNCQYYKLEKFLPTINTITLLLYNRSLGQSVAKSCTQQLFILSIISFSSKVINESVDSIPLFLTDGVIVVLTTNSSRFPLVFI